MSIRRRNAEAGPARCAQTVPRLLLLRMVEMISRRKVITKKIIRLALLLAAMIWLLHPPRCAAQAIVADPLLDYYQANDSTIEEPVQVISCHFTAEQRESFLITDASQSGYRHSSDSDWTFYYPINGGKYRKTLNGYSGDVPDYIGYVKKLGTFAIITEVIARHESEDNIIWADYLKNDDLQNVALMSGTGDIDQKFPSYFNSGNVITPRGYTIAELEKKYPNARLDTGIVDDPLRNYVTSDGFFSPHKTSRPIKVYRISVKFTDDNRESIFITNDSSKYLNDVGALPWQFYRPTGVNQYSCASRFLTNVEQDHGRDDSITAPLSGPAYIGYINQINGFGAIYIDKQNNGWLQIQYADGNLIRTNIATGSDRDQYKKYIESPKTYKIDSYNLEELREKYKSQ